jgi:hypothetical protein
MKLRILTLLFGAVAFAAGASGQEYFIFSNHLGDTVHIPVDKVDIGTHYLGENIAVKYYRLRETYTHEESGSAANPIGHTIVSKPTIYYSLKKLNSNYKKQLKSGAIDSRQAVKQLGWYFDVGFAIFEQDTGELEKALRNAKNPDEIAQIFAHVKLE